MLKMNTYESPLQIQQNIEIKSASVQTNNNKKIRANINNNNNNNEEV